MTNALTITVEGEGTVTLEAVCLDLVEGLREQGGWETLAEVEEFLRDLAPGQILATDADDRGNWHLLCRDGSEITYLPTLGQWVPVIGHDHWAGAEDTESLAPVFARQAAAPRPPGATAHFEGTALVWRRARQGSSWTLTWYGERQALAGGSVPLKLADGPAICGHCWTADEVEQFAALTGGFCIAERELF